MLSLQCTHCHLFARQWVKLSTNHLSFLTEQNDIPQVYSDIQFNISLDEFSFVYFLLRLTFWITGLTDLIYTVMFKCSPNFEQCIIHTTNLPVKLKVCLKHFFNLEIQNDTTIIDTSWQWYSSFCSVGAPLWAWEPLQKELEAGGKILYVLHQAHQSCKIRKRLNSWVKEWATIYQSTCIYEECKGWVTHNIAPVA